jgi:hypothetical protein
MRSYSYTRRRGYIKLIGVLIATVIVAYYGYIGVKCFRHCQALVDNKATTINFNINN